MNSLIFAWIASITYGLYAVTAKLIGKYQLKNSNQFSFFITLFSGIIMSAISYYNGGRIATEWTYILLAGLFLSIGSAFYLATLKVLDVSVMSPLFNVRVAITVILGAIFLGESLTTKSVYLIILIFIAGFFATMDERFSIKAFLNKNIGIGLFFMFILSIQSLLINRAIDQTNYWTAMLWMSILAPIFSFLFLYPKFKHDLPNTKLNQYIGVLILSVIGGIGDLSAYKAFEGNVGLSSVIISLPVSMVLAFVLSLWKPDLMEKHPIKVYTVRFLAAGVMIWSALQLK